MIDLRELPIEKLIRPEDCPFIFREDENFTELKESIELNGVITPVTVRIAEGGNFEIISGVRRIEACRALKIKTVPAVVKDISKDEAIIIMVDANLQRDSLLPSEKAHAYKMKLDALKRQGERSDLTSAQPVQKLTSVEKIAEDDGTSRETVRRYIRLNYLIDELLKMVDEGRIALTPATELSYLTPYEQEEVLSFFESDEITPSYPQAVRLKKLSEEGLLNIDIIEKILTEPKPNQQEKISIKLNDIKKFIPGGYSPKDINNLIIKLLEQWHRKLIRDRDCR